MVCLMNEDRFIEWMEDKFPNRNWRMFYGEYKSGCKVPYSIRIAIERELKSFSKL